MLDQKKVLITGATTPIGLKIIQALQHKYKQVEFVCVTRSKERLISLFDSNAIDTSQIIIAECDLSNYTMASHCLLPILEKKNTIDAVLNIAGMFISKPFLDCDENDFELLVSSNLKTTCVATNIALPYLLRNRGGSIVNLSSTLGLHTIEGTNNVVYDSVKAAIIKFTQSLAKELGPNNIRVNCICPGILVDDMPQDKIRNIAGVLATQPLKRFGNAEEIADAIMYVLSPEASWMTGNIMSINGGINL